VNPVTFRIFWHKKYDFGPVPLQVIKYLSKHGQAVFAKINTDKFNICQPTGHLRMGAEPNFHTFCVSNTVVPRQVRG
jgi:hypothetical protein